MKQMHLRNTPSGNVDNHFPHPDFFRFLFQSIKPENYLELGVRDGACFTKVAPLCKKATGVDADPSNRGKFTLAPNMKYFEMTTDEYFEQLDKDELFDVIFIDADHSHEQSLKDFINAKEHLMDDGFVFFHDTYPFNESYMAVNKCNYCYKTALYIKQNFIDDFEIITLPFNPGVSIVKKIPRNCQLIYQKK